VKILFISTYYDPDLVGGVEVVLRSLAQGLRARGHDIAVLCTARDGPLREEMVDGVRVWRCGIPNRYWPADGVPRSARQRAAWHRRDAWNPEGEAIAAEVIRRFVPDVVCTESLAGFSIAVWGAAYNARLPVVHVVNDLYLLAPSHAAWELRWQRPFGRLFRLRHRAQSARLSAVIGLSKSVLVEHQEAGFFRGVRAEVIPTALAIPDPGKTVPCAPDASLRLGYLGRLVAAKGIELLLAGFVSLPGLPAELFVGGDGAPAYFSTLRRRFRDRRLHFLGRVEAATFFSRIDVLIVPSLRFDTLPNVVIESGAYRVPVIGARVGGIPELIRDGKNGFVMDLRTHADMRRALTFMAEQRSGLVAMRATCRAAVAPWLDGDRQFTAYEALFAALSA
jgi:glycosyltransferase involved in cell wall biosynthesis